MEAVSARRPIEAVGQLDIEFVQRRKRPSLARATLASAVTVVVLALIGDFLLKQEEDQLTVEIARLNDEKLAKQHQAKASVVDPLLERQLKEVAQANEAIKYPWNVVFNELELAADVENVALLTMTHDRESRKTVITVEALDVDSALRYLEKLNESAKDDKAWTMTNYQLQQKAVPSTIRAQLKREPVSTHE